MDLARDNFLDHFRNPRNYGQLRGAAIRVSQNNPSCGDAITINLDLSENGKIVRAVSFTGTGCAISVASASMLTEYIKGKTTPEILAIQKEDVERLLGIKLTLARIKCALLPLETIHQALQK